MNTWLKAFFSSYAIVPLFFGIVGLWVNFFPSSTSHPFFKGFIVAWPLAFLFITYGVTKYAKEKIMLSSELETYRAGQINNVAVAYISSVFKDNEIATTIKKQLIKNPSLLECQNDLFDNYPELRDKLEYK